LVDDDETTEEDLNNHVEHLQSLLEETSDEDEARRIRVEIDCTKQRMTRFVLTAASRQSDTKKEVLRADKYLHRDEEENLEPQDEELERLAREADREKSIEEIKTSKATALEDLDDELWEIDIPDTDEDIPDINIPLNTIRGVEIEDDEIDESYTDFSEENTDPVDDNDKDLIDSGTSNDSIESQEEANIEFLEKNLNNKNSNEDVYITDDIVTNHNIEDIDWPSSQDHETNNSEDVTPYKGGETLIDGPDNSQDDNTDNDTDNDPLGGWGDSGSDQEDKK
jgi:hypothetical protein